MEKATDAITGIAMGSLAISSTGLMLNATNNIFRQAQGLDRIGQRRRPQRRTKKKAAHRKAAHKRRRS